VVRGGGEGAQLSPFDSAPVVSAIATAPVPVITGIGHSHHDTLADAAAWQACVSPAAAAAVIAERLQRAERTLDQELAAIRRAAQARLAAGHAARWRRLGIAAVAAACLATVAAWWGGWLAAAAVVLLVLATVAVRRRRPVWPRPQPAADTFEDVVQELGAVKAALQQGAATGEDVRRLLEAAGWLERRGGELLGRDRSASRPAISLGVAPRKPDATARGDSIGRRQSKRSTSSLDARVITGKYAASTASRACAEGRPA
jgi:hypothetical protein